MITSTTFRDVFILLYYTENMKYYDLLLYENNLVIVENMI